MDERVTQEQLDAWRALAQQARHHISDLSAGRARWRMCVPVQPDDSDVMLSGVCNATLARLEEVARLEAENARMRELLKDFGSAMLQAQKLPDDAVVSIGTWTEPVPGWFPQFDAWVRLTAGHVKQAWQLAQAQP